MTLSDYVQVGGLLAVVISLLYQMSRDRRAKEEQTREIVRAAKVRVVSDLVALRYILTEQGRETPEIGTLRAQFNSTLNRIPIDFIDSPRVLAAYQALGVGFHADKFYTLIREMLVSAEYCIPKAFTVELITDVPSANPDPIDTTNYINMD